jgi:hypothetical protein
VTYGDEVALDFNAVMPTLTTGAFTNKNIGNGSVTLHGEILTVGDPAYLEKGFVYGTMTNPTVDHDKKAVSGTGTGAFSANLTDLKEGNIYHIKAYVTNAAGTVYGGEIVCDFNGTQPSLTTGEITGKNIGNGSVTLHGEILTVGDPAYTERGFVYSTMSNPTVDDAKRTVSGTGTGAFSANVTNLTEGNIYHVKAYAINAAGTVYGEEVICDFNGILPALTTEAVTNRNISNGSATLHGTVLTVGDPAYTEHGFVYSSTIQNPTVNDDKKTVQGSGMGQFSVNLTGLTEGNTYYIRAYATNLRGTAYGDAVSLDFNAVMPVVITQEVSNIDVTSARFNGSIESIGDPACTERGFAYGTMRNPTVDDNEKKTVSGIGTGAFFADITELVTGTTYYVRAYAVNSKGTEYGQEVSFKAESPYYVILPLTGIMVQKTDINTRPGIYETISSLCANSTVGGYTDWRLPTKDELAVLYNNRIEIGGFTIGISSWYWSSTIDSGAILWIQDFYDGEQKSQFNSYSNRGRAVRTLP